MDDDERVMRETWSVVGGDDPTIADVIARHREPHRHYHSPAHVAWVVRVAHELLGAEPPADIDANAVLVAALFHDVVYDPRAADNEARSAHLAADACGALGWSSERRELVVRLILATASHEPADGSEAVLLDADLSILGTDAATYARYVGGVRAEYAHVDDHAWRSGRGEVLRRFLDRPSIYATAMMRARAESSARANLTAELAALQR